MSLIGSGSFVRWNSVVDVVIFLGLAYGVYRKSRVAATALFAYHLLNNMAMYRLTGELGTMLSVAPLV